MSEEIKKSEPITKPAPPTLASALAGLSTSAKPAPAETVIAETLAEIVQPAEAKAESQPVPVASLPADDVVNGETEKEWNERVRREAGLSNVKSSADVLATQPVTQTSAVPQFETERQWSERMRRLAEAKLLDGKPAVSTPDLHPPTPPEPETLEEFKSKLADHRQVNPSAFIVR